MSVFAVRPLIEEFARWLWNCRCLRTFDYIILLL